ncbi:MAG: metallophosphoesterase family protein, partial [Acidimicrobiales bacterium]
VNDLHFGEISCGATDDPDVGPVLSAGPGERPYPVTMNEAAAGEIAGAAPDLVLAKGDLTDGGRPEEMSAFLDCYAGAFGERLAWVRGNHDVSPGARVDGPDVLERWLPGLVVAALDTTSPGEAGGRVRPDQLDWLDELAARADRPVLVAGHHQPRAPGSPIGPRPYFGIDPASSEALVELVARRPSILAYVCGHTHRNRVRRFERAGEVPWIEVSCVKDFPGSWAEYRVFEGGLLQVHRRISTPEALAWSERCRQMVFGLYAGYALGSLEDRCLAILPRRGSPSAP